MLEISFNFFPPEYLFIFIFLVNVLLHVLAGALEQNMTNFPAYVGNLLLSFGLFFLSFNGSIFI